MDYITVFFVCLFGGFFVFVPSLICFRLIGSDIILILPLLWKPLSCSFASSGYPDSDSGVISQAVWCKQAQTSLMQTHTTEAPLFHHCGSYAVFTQLNFPTT